MNLPQVRNWLWAPRAWCVRNRLFVLITLVPTTLATVYFSAIASDVYVSESSIVVRSAQSQAASETLGGILRDVGFARAQDDAYTVQEFLLSRDALKMLNDDKDLQIGRAFSSPKVDRLSRFAGLTGDTSFEALYLYYQKKVTAVLDPNSSIIELTTAAFSAADAYQMNRRLLEQAEDLVNRLNAQARQDMVGFALAEVARDQKQAIAAELALGEYRNKMHVLDPEKEAPISLQLISKLQDDLIATRAEEFQIELLTKGNPKLPVVQQRVAMLEHEIENEKERVAGAEQTSLAGKAVNYQGLMVERDSADKMLISSMSALEQARNEALRKQLYLERIVEPGKPDFPTEPKRLRDVLVTLIVSLMTWGILSLFIAGVKEHHE